VLLFEKSVPNFLQIILFQAAFGFLLHSFLSPAANQRKDNYGGSFENRIRLLVEIVDLVKAEVPAGFPIGVRMPATDHLEYDESIPQWNLEQSAKLAKILAEHGVSYIDVSSGALDRRQKMKYGKGYQVDLAKQIKKALEGTSVIVGVSGSVITGQQAQNILDSSAADVVVSGRAFVKNPNLVWQWAEELDVDIHVASQCELRR
jgi:2,4-dienoyl-CoA reductase-like NADH-dependent reductase (Old Yellow Enzyme family)